MATCDRCNNPAVTLNTIKNKIKTIRALKFLKNLIKLENSYNFFDYYRKFILYFIDIIRPL